MRTPVCCCVLAGAIALTWVLGSTGGPAGAAEPEPRMLSHDVYFTLKDKASHDKYADAPRHHKFIEEFKDNWESVRVFDSWLDVSSHGMVPVEADRAD